jgi:hypothetical protein
MKERTTVNEKVDTPVLVTFNEALAYIKYLRDFTGDHTLNLPTKDHIVAAKSNPQIHCILPEWTREKWVYNPHRRLQYVRRKSREKKEDEIVPRIQIQRFCHPCVERVQG